MVYKMVYEMTHKMGGGVIQMLRPFCQAMTRIKVYMATRPFCFFYRSSSVFINVRRSVMIFIIFINIWCFAFIWHKNHWTRSYQCSRGQLFQTYVSSKGNVWDISTIRYRMDISNNWYLKKWICQKIVIFSYLS